MKSILIACFILTLYGVTTCSGQRSQLRAFKVCDLPRWLTLHRGDTLFVNCDSVKALNGLGWARYNQKFVSLHQSLKSRIASGDSIIRVKDSTIISLENVIARNKIAYDSVRFRFSDAEGLVNRSTDNTDRALLYIKKIKITSWATGTVMGALSGGLIGARFDSETKNEIHFNLPGAIIGGILGLAVSYYVTN